MKELVVGGNAREDLQGVLGCDCFLLHFGSQTLVELHAM